MRRANNLFDDLKNTYLIYGFYRRYKATKRLKNIRRNKARIPPYLKKTFEQELNYKLWSTKGARFEACTRNLLQKKLSSHSVGYLSAYLIVINIVHIYGLKFWNLDITANDIAFASTAFSVLILLYSQLENAEDHGVKAEKYHSCALEIGELYNKLRLSKSHETDEEKAIRIKEISNDYDLVLRKYTNHYPIDIMKFKLSKHQYHGLNMFQRIFGNVKYYFFVRFRYHLLIYGPIVAFIAFNLLKNEQ